MVTSMSGRISVGFSGGVSWVPLWASGAGLNFLETRQEVNDIDQHRAQAVQETHKHLTLEVWKEGIRDGKMIPCKNEDLSFVLKTHIKKLGGVANDFSPSTAEVEISRLLGLSRHPAWAPGLRESLSYITGF